MVGHTGVFEAAVKAIEATDDGVGKVVDAILKMGGQCLITAGPRATSISARTLTA